MTHDFEPPTAEEAAKNFTDFANSLPSVKEAAENLAAFGKTLRENSISLCNQTTEEDEEDTPRCESCGESFDEVEEAGEWVEYPSGHSSDWHGYGICRECHDNPYEDPYMEVVRENCAAL